VKYITTMIYICSITLVNFFCDSWASCRPKVCCDRGLALMTGAL